MTRLDTQLEHAAENITRSSLELANTLRLMRNAMGGQPGAQHFEQSRTTGHTTVIDDQGDSMPAVCDPTGEAAIRRADGLDRAANDHRELSKLIGRLKRDSDRLLDIQARYRLREANKIERASTVSNEPGCESCVRIEASPGVRRWEPIRCAIEHNGRKVQVCRWCQDFVARKDRLPTVGELVDHHAGKRVVA